MPSVTCCSKAARRRQCSRSVRSLASSECTVRARLVALAAERDASLVLGEATAAVAKRLARWKARRRTRSGLSDAADNGASAPQLPRPQPTAGPQGLVATRDPAPGLAKDLRVCRGLRSGWACGQPDALGRAARHSVAALARNDIDRVVGREARRVQMARAG